MVSPLAGSPGRTGEPEGLGDESASVEIVVMASNAGTAKTSSA
jgi:hypothetical protein